MNAKVFLILCLVAVASSKPLLGLLGGSGHAAGGVGVGAGVGINVAGIGVGVGAQAAVAGEASVAGAGALDAGAAVGAVLGSVLSR